MCGIVGLVEQSASVPEKLLVEMRDTMTHRGPDDAGHWLSPDSRIGLAHRRLSIIDLSPGGHQPMTDAAGQMQLAFNGEIYNFQELRRELEGLGHQFRSSSDSEVILEAYRAWGLDCLSRLNGMFAFALYDAKTKQLHIARDRAGEKPLFYYHTDNHFAFRFGIEGADGRPRDATRAELRGAGVLSRLRLCAGRNVHVARRLQTSARSCTDHRNPNRRAQCSRLLATSPSSNLGEARILFAGVDRSIGRIVDRFGATAPDR